MFIYLATIGTSRKKKLWHIRLYLSWLGVEGQNVNPEGIRHYVEAAWTWACTPLPLLLVSRSFTKPKGYQKVQSEGWPGSSVGRSVVLICKAADVILGQGTDKN